MLIYKDISIYSYDNEVEQSDVIIEFISDITNYCILTLNTIPMLTRIKNSGIYENLTIYSPNYIKDNMLESIFINYKKPDMNKYYTIYFIPPEKMLRSLNRFFYYTQMTLYLIEENFKYDLINNRDNIINYCELLDAMDKI